MAKRNAVVEAVRLTLTELERPLKPAEVALLTAAIARAGTVRSGREAYPPELRDVVDDLTRAITDAVMAGDPGPAVQAIRRLLTDLRPDDPRENMPNNIPGNVTPPVGVDYAADPAEARERAELAGV